MNESNFRNELEEVWVPKDAGELEGLLLAIQNEPGKRILKHKIQQAVKEKEERRKNSLYNWDRNLYYDNYDDGWDDYPRDWDDIYVDYPRDWDDSGGTDWENYLDDTFEPPGSDDSES